MLQSRIVVLAVLVASLAWPLGAMAQGETTQGAEVVGGPVTPTVVNIDLRDLPRAPEWRPGDPIKEIPRRFYGKPDANIQPGPGSRDPLAELQASTTPSRSRAYTTPLLNQDGQLYNGVNPPDTVGDVGPTYYIQAINASGGGVFTVYNKDGSVAAGPTLMDSLGSGACSSGLGDPIVLYDRLAERWFLQEFSNTANALCIYISQGPDPITSGWYSYQFNTPSFPDYPHFGVWPDAYYATSNEGTPPAYALDRVSMLAGQPATMQRFSATQLSGYGFEALTPADLDGADAPPAGAPGIIMRHHDDEAHSTPDNPATDFLEMWAFHVDWTTPANSTFTKLPDITITDYNSWFIDYSTFYSVPQPGTGSRLDPIREVILNRLQYRNFGDHESLVGVFPTNINPATSGSTVNAGLRWFELRKSGDGPWALHQEGTYDVGVATQNRFVGSIAMDQSGNMALGYSFTDTAGTPASVRYTGRSFDAPTLGAMDQAETELVLGSGSGGGRWGDYASMNVDPEDDCTFWFTGEYIKTGSSWGTRIGSFRFDACGCALEITAPLASAAAIADNVVEVAWDDSSEPTIVEYRVFRAVSSGGPWELATTIPDTSPGSGGGAGYTWQDTSVSGGTTYHYVVRSSDGGACLSAPSNEVSALATGACTLAPLFDGVESAGTLFSSTCAVDVAWTAATSRCSGAPIFYSVHRSTTPGFVPGPATVIASNVSGTSFTDSAGLDSGVPYFYMVRATDAVSAVEDGNTAEASAIPAGPITLGTFADDAGDIGVAQLVMTSPWAVSTTSGVGGSRSYDTGEYTSNLCTPLETPELTLGAGSTLSFWAWHQIESGWDKGEVQISTDGGSSWARLALTPDYPNSSSYTSDECDLPTGRFFTGTNTTWTEYTADLSSFDGLSVMVRWLLSTDGSVVDDGWRIDNLTITQAGVPGACTPGVAGTVFADGFESGTTTAWSLVIP